MGAIFGGGGGAPSGSGTSGQPATGTAQIYQPQNQPGFDQSYQTLLNQLYNPALTSIQQFGSQQPAETAYNRGQPIFTDATTPTGTQGAFGVYGDQSVNNAMTALQAYQAIYPQIQGAGATAQQAGLFAIPQVESAAFSPQYSQAVQDITANPYFNAALAGANRGAQIGDYTANLVPNQGSILNSWAGAFPQAGQTAAGTTTAAIPQLTGLVAGAAGLAPSLSSAATGLSPQLQRLYDQIVPSLTGAASQYGAQAGATTPYLQGFEPYATGLTAAAPGYAGQAAATNQSLQPLAGLPQSLASAAPGYAGQASSLTPYIESVLQGGTIPQSQALADQAGGLASRYPADLAAAYKPLGQAATSILNTGFDPQSQLYNRTATNVMDQEGALNAMSGVADTPYGQGLAADQIQSFNIDWQNQQLARQAQAASSAGNLVSYLPAFQQQALTGLGTAEQAQQQPAGQALALAGTQQAGAGLSAGLLSALTQGAVGAGTSLAGQNLAGTTAGAGLLNALIQGGGNLATGLSGAQLANTAAGAGIYGSLLPAAAGAGGALTSGQLSNLTGAGGLYSNLANTSGNLATGIGGLAGAGLNQQISPIQAAQNIYGGNLAQGGAASQLVAQSAAQPANAFQQQMLSELAALNAQTGAAGTGAGALGALTNQLSGAGQLQTGALSNLAQFGQLPYSAATQTQQNALNALIQQAQLGQAQYSLPQQVINDLQSYLQLGQSASNISGNLGQLGTNQLQSGMLGLGLGAGLLGQGLGGGSGIGSGIGSLIGSLPQQAAGPTLSGAAGYLTGGSGLLGALGGAGSWLGNLFPAALAA